MTMMHEGAASLREFAETGSEAVFRNLVAAHVDLVHATALRRVNGDAHLAEDITQTVFTDLVRQAPRLPADTVLAGWLYQHTCFKAAEAIRAARRRTAREQTAALMQALDNSGHEADWQEISPLLDEAMNELPATDRDALVLRFFQERDLQAVGAALGVSDDTAQKRVSRALDRLRDRLARRGITSTTVALATAIGTHAVSAAPVGLAARMATAAWVGGTAASVTGVSALLLHVMNLTKIQTAVICAVLATIPLAVQQRAAAASRREAAQVSGDLARLHTDLDALQARNVGWVRQADQLQRSRLQWERERFIGQAVAAGRGGQNTEALYRWNDADDFVRLPKSVLTNLALRDWEIPASVGSERSPRQPIAPDGSPSDVLLDVFNLDESKREAVREYCRQFFRAYDDNTRLRSQFLTEIPTNIEGIVLQPRADLHLRITERLPEAESNALREEFRTGLAARLGEGPAAAFWSQISESFGRRCDEFGAFSRMLGVRPSAPVGPRPEDRWIVLRLWKAFGVWQWDGEIPGYRFGKPELITELASGPAIRFDTQPQTSKP